MISKRLLHLFVKLESPAEIMCQLMDIISIMDADSSLLGWGHIHIYIEQELSFLFLSKVGRSHALQLGFVNRLSSLLL